MAWSREVLSVWGKTASDVTDESAESWLPLVRHLLDAAAVGGQLFDRWLTESQRKALSEAVGSMEQARALACFLCGVHDIGKCSPAFAVKARSIPAFGFLHEQMRAAGFMFDPRLVGPLRPHGLVGQVILQDYLVERGASVRIARKYAGIVGGHHGKNPTSADLAALETWQRGAGLWRVAQTEILDGMAARTGADLFLGSWTQKRLPITAQFALAGLVIVADWMASSVDLFPYGGGGRTEERLASAMETLDLPHPWAVSGSSADATAMLGARFPGLQGCDPQPIQKSIVEIARSLSVPGLIIIEAPMGEGKTEAAQLAAEVLAAKFGQGGTFWGLPTMATANPMFPRIQHWLECVPSIDSTALNLVHGKAALNDDFGGLLRQSRIRGVGIDESNERDGATEVYVSSWFWGRKKSSLASHVVGTIDQALFAGLKAKHVVLRHLGLSGKVVVIDEVHAADDYMRAYLCRVLEWLGAYQTPVILMSATLPPQHRESLIEAYQRGRGSDVIPSAGDVGYPMITTVTDEVRHATMPSSQSGREVKLAPHGDTVDEISGTLDSLLVDGGCAGIICNTVSRAQEVYLRLRKAFGADVVLVHSKFLAPHRAAREARLVNELGRSGLRPQRRVVVGTQVLEQSLDIDFDVLFTDVAPMDLMLQRIGRLHRHRRGPGESDRPAAVRRPTCHVIGVSDWVSSPPQLDKGSVAVYGASKLLRCLVVLGQEPWWVRLPAGIPLLVAASYDPGLPSPSGWQEHWIAAEEQASVEATRQTSRAAAFCLEGPDRGDLNGLISNPAEDPDNPGAGGRAQVRDSDESIEVIVVRTDAAGQLVTMAGIGEKSGRVIPLVLGARDGGLAKAMASCTVALPRFYALPGVIDQTIAELEKFDCSGWQGSMWLQGQLFLVLGPDSSTELVGRRLRYDDDLGLTMESTDG